MNKQSTLSSIMGIVAMVLLGIGMLSISGALFAMIFAGTKAAIVTFVYGSMFSVVGCMMFAGLEA